MLEVDSGTCTGCGACVDTCPFSALEVLADGIVSIDTEACMECGACVGDCPNDALSL